MKKLFGLMMLLVVAAGLKAQTIEQVDFKKTAYSFGKIKQHVPASTTFTFVNNSDKALIIESATAECGCTTPEYPKTPVLKGKSATIKVTYNAESPGSFTKKVTVKFAELLLP